MLARRVLLLQSKELLVDERRLDRLGSELGTVLRLIQDRYTALAEIAARQPSSELRLEMEGSLLDDIAERWTDLIAGAVSCANAVFPTGHVAFDHLSVKLGLRTIEFWPDSNVVFLRFGEQANLRAASEAYSAIADVSHARFDGHRIDGSDIAMRNMNGLWRVVMRKAWGDCPRRCVYKETYYFTVKSGLVERIEEEATREMAEFRMIEALAKLGW